MLIRFSIPEIVLGSLLTIAVFSMGMMFESSRHPSSTKGAEYSQKSQSILVPTDSVGLYTLVLAVVSVFQGALLLRSDKTARRAADAANLNAKAAIALQVPIIRAHAQKLGYETSQDNTGLRSRVYVRELFLSNVGATKAFPIEIQIGCTIGETLPNIPAYAFHKPFTVNTILESEKNLEVKLLEYDFDAPEDIYNMLRTGSTNLWFYCNFIYLDFMQVRHEAGFCWKCCETIGMGTLVEHHAVAYTRKT